MVALRWTWSTVTVVWMLGACTSSDSDSDTSSNPGTTGGSTVGSTSSTVSSAEITGDAGWVCPPNATEELLVTAQQVESVLGGDNPLTEDNCLAVCEQYSTATYESDPDHDWSLTGCSLADDPTSTSGGGSSDSTGTSAGADSTGSSTGADAGPYALTCHWFPGCM